ncbi:MAG: outer membrane beta-barrel protein, partial [Flavobacteriaceae bacterium]|nr:outer membrane beta-barrel protein [Flavobacteriaceae bacterium]
MKKSFVMGALLSLFVGYSQAQVKDISVTVSPTVEYTWWNNKTILKDTPLIGGRVGFGFGRYFEVRGLYMKSVNLKAKLEDVNMKYVKGLTNEIAKDMEDTKVDVTRFGGELKANIALSNKFAPYITLGTGVQKFKFKRENQKLDDYEEEQVYASAGLGIKLNLSDRMVLALEGRNTM